MVAVRAWLQSWRSLRRRWSWWHARKQIAERMDAVTVALADGSIPLAVGHLEAQMRFHHWPFQVDALLFKRSSRPNNIDHCLELLERLHGATALHPHQRFYAGIALIHTALLVDDERRLHRLHPWLLEVSALDSGALPTAEPHARNRESVFKQRVSARSCLLQCCFASTPRDDTCITAIGMVTLQMLEHLQPNDVAPDVLYRSCSNLVRSLMALPLQHAEKAQRQLQRLQEIIDQRQFRRSRREARENHAAVIADALQCLNVALLKGATAAAPQRLQLMVNSESTAVRQGAQRWLGLRGA